MASEKPSLALCEGVQQKDGRRLDSQAAACRQRLSTPPPVGGSQPGCAATVGDASEDGILGGVVESVYSCWGRAWQGAALG